ncbi:small basic family protein [Moorella sp. ACPs]|uniref:small basic family protein n=1 Tax=Neomoorella carbonis TaxID=3062783 RepID=UPI00324B5175
MWIPLIGLIFGVLIGLLLPVKVPVAYSKYMSVAVLAALDSVFGGLRASMEENFDNAIFLTGFFSNTLLAAFLAYIGDQLGVELYLAAVLVFGMRLFQNLAIIRRHLLKK